MVELRKTFVVCLVNIDPDTCDVSQMKPVAYTEKEHYAKTIAECLSQNDDGGDGCRVYKYINLAESK